MERRVSGSCCLGCYIIIRLLINDIFQS
jgi:hypothetical protein